MNRRIFGTLLFGTMLVLGALANIGASCCVGSGCEPTDDDGNKVFENDDFTFSYPSGFEKLKEDRGKDDQPAGNREYIVIVGADEKNLVSISKFTLRLAVNDAFIRENGRALENELAGLLEAEGAEFEAFVVDRVDDLPTLRVTGTDDDGKRFHTWRFVFDEKDEYFINCQWRDGHEDEIDEACDLIVDTFALK